MNALLEIQKPIASELERYNNLFHESLQTDNPLLKIAINHLVKRKGKQMRPIMVLLAAKGIGQVTDEVLHAALAMEFLHTASLIHDDIVDESDKRRGQKSVNCLLDNKAAVLVGDYILSKALDHAAATGNIDVVRKVSILGQTLADGELIQLNNTTLTDFSESSYYDVIRKKTASLFMTCAEVGALLAGADSGYCFLMKRFGTLIGMCFQLRDDIFDLEDNTEIGKPLGNDLKEGKLTLPVLFVCNTLPEAAEIGLKVRKGEATEAEIARLVALVHENNGILYAEKAMDDITGMALGLIDDIKDEAIAEAFNKYLSFVSKRNI